MALGSGLAAQVGYASETQYGLATTVTRFHPLVDEGIANEIERIESAGIVAGARVLRSPQWKPGNQSVGGDLGMELYEQGMGILFEHMLGSVTSSATGGVATHTFTPGDLTSKSLTIQVGRPTVAGTVIPYTSAGCKISEWELAVEAGSAATLGLTVLAKSQTDQIALASATYLTGALAPFVYTEGGISVSGSTVKVRSLTISGNNSLADDRRNVGDPTIDEPLEAELREYTGTMTMEFSGTSQYDRYIAGLEVPVVLSLSAGADAQATITLNARFDGETPAVSGKELIVHNVPFKAVGTTNDQSAITAVLINAQTSP